MKLTKELLIKHDACKEGIKFFERNKLEGFPLSRLGEVKGDFKGYIGWIKLVDFNELVKSSEFIKDPQCTYDKNGNKLSFEDSGGFWYKRTYDENGNVLSYKNSRGFWWKKTYDSNGNRLSIENSGGYWEKSIYDEENNELSYENSGGLWSRYIYDEGGNLLSHENNYRDSITYEYLYYPNKQLKSIHKNGEEILNIPLI